MDTVAGQRWVVVGEGALGEAEGEEVGLACLGLRYLQKVTKIHLFARKASVRRSAVNRAHSALLIAEQVIFSQMGKPLQHFNTLSSCKHM